jgi:DNA polymerase III epsilon subunit-like protein
MAILLGIDFETTGVYAPDCHIIEIGAALYNTETKSTSSAISMLIKSPDMVISPEITQLTGIHPCDVVEFGVSLQGAIAYVAKMAGKSAAWVAHNASFEQSFMDVHCPLFLKELPLLDTMKDIPYPSHIRHRDLERLSLSHGCPNLMAHRALPDVFAMFEILKRYDWGEVETYWKEPSCTYQAQCSFDDKDQAKSLGFAWDGDRKMWLKDLRQEECLDLCKRVQDEGLSVTIVRAI